MSHRYFESKLHSTIYSISRPVPPPQLIQRIISYLKEKYTGELNLAVDVGCGTGQSTSFFSPYFKKVVGTDISQSQIEKAVETNQLKNVEYVVSPAEKIPSEDSQVQLIAVSQAAHWFNLPTFYEEGGKKLCKNGVMALFGYEFPRFVSSQKEKNSLLDEALDNLYRVDLKGYWAEERKLVDSRYVNYTIPYNDFMRDDSFYHEMETKVSDLAMYCRSWSGYQNFCKKNGEEQGLKLIEKFQNRVMEVLDVKTPPDETKLVKRTSFFLLMARK